MANLATDFEAAAGAETILAAVLSAPYDFRYSDTPPAYVGTVLSWVDARPILDYDYNSGFGGADCHAAYAWTETRVLFVHEYDGATGIQWVPRNPAYGAPDYGGTDDT